MKKQITENQNRKLTKLEDELHALWELLTSSEKERNSVFNKFLELQKRAQGIRQRNQFLQEKGNK